MHFELVYLTVVFLIYRRTFSFNFKCPHWSQRDIRAKQVCNNNPRLYSCLFDTNERKYVEHCNVPVDYSAPGQKYVFSGRRRNVKCANGRYQPFPLWSNESSMCFFTKSFCNDEGLVIYNNNSTIKDTSCRCDYTEGYVFVTQPKHPCYCIPSEEDCSCYKNRCPLDYVLDSDYKCSSKLGTNCKVIEIHSTSNDSIPEIIYKISSNENEVHLDNGYNLKAGIGVMASVTLAGVMIYCSNNLLKKRKVSKKIKLVAGIDLGSTYTGYAFSTVKSFQRNPLDITSNSKWVYKSSDLYTMKTPTCVLLNEDGEFDSLGYDAQHKYNQLLMQEGSTEYRYVEKFKMKLYKSNNISEEMEIEDFQRKPVKATVVFTAVLKELMRMVVKSNEHINSDDIQWVVTVPAVWSIKNIDFMRKCAEKAGMASENLKIVLESDAVSVYYTYLYKDHPKLNKDTNYIVVDIGGGTIDVTALQRTAFRELKELCEPLGDDSGATTVDEEFLGVLEEIVGKNVMEKLEIDPKYRDSWFDLLREVESFKRDIFSTATETISFKPPMSDLDELCALYHNKKLEKVVSESPFCKSVNVNKHYLTFSVSFITFLFTTIVQKIIENIRKMEKRLHPTQINTIVLAGGFSSSRIVIEKLKNTFPNIKLVAPPDSDDANLMVAKGAVLYGHQPVITLKISPYTYGRALDPIFDENEHDEIHSTIINGIKRCKGFFDVILRKNESIKVGTVVKKVYTEIQSDIIISIFRTEKEVKYVDDEGCKLFAEAIVEVPNNKRRTVDVNFEFGSIGFKVKASDKKTKKQFKVLFTLK